MLAYTTYETDPRVIRAAEAALEGNFSVDVIALRRDGQLPVETLRGVRVFHVNQERYRGPSWLRYLLSYIAFFLRCAALSTRLFVRRRYTAIHVHNMPDALVFSVLIPRLLGAKVVLDIHDPMPETFASKFGSDKRTALRRVLLWLERLSVDFANATITVSEPVKTAILLKHGHRPEAIGVVLNVADDRLFRPMAYPPVDGTVRFVFHGSILERYGFRTLLDALTRIRNRDRIQVRIIGEGDFSATLARDIRSRGLGDVVEFVNRLYPLHEIPRVLGDCHVGLVLLGTSEIAHFVLPLKLLEYTCLGMPSIAVRNATIEHYFRSDECMFFDSGDTRALAQLIDRVAENPTCLFEYRKRLEVARERLLWKREKQKYITLLHALTGHLPRVR